MLTFTVTDVAVLTVPPKKDRLTSRIARRGVMPRLSTETITIYCPLPRSRVTRALSSAACQRMCCRWKRFLAIPDFSLTSSWIRGPMAWNSFPGTRVTPFAVTGSCNTTTAWIPTTSPAHIRASWIFRRGAARGRANREVRRRTQRRAVAERAIQPQRAGDSSVPR